MDAARPEEVGLDPARVERLFATAERMAAAGWMFGGAFALARRGRLDAARRRPARADDVYTILMAWADPARALVFVGLTAGLIHEHRHILRMHTLSDLAQACVVD